jgi:L-ascorbate metabolism protein UlaG (beta-lactamase superfamily)
MKIGPAIRAGKLYLNPVPTSVGSPAMIFKLLPLYLANKAEKVPKRQLGPFQTDARIYDTPPQSGLRITWMGHSTMLLEIDSLRILIDPVWNQRASPVEWSGPKRFFAPPLRLEDLPQLDAVLLSHDHYDHLGANTVRRLAKIRSTAAATWITTLGVGKRLRRYGVKPEAIRELNWTDTATVGPITLTALPARHFSGRGMFDRFKTLWASFVIAGPAHRVYYGADSGEWEGFAEIGQEFGPFDLTMLEIGAFHPLWADIHMGPDGAARTFQALGGTGLLMPIHWGLFDLALHAWREPIERIFSLPNLKLWSPNPVRQPKSFPKSSYDQTGGSNHHPRRLSQESPVPRKKSGAPFKPLFGLSGMAMRPEGHGLAAERLKGHSFSRAIKVSQIKSALAVEGPSPWLYKINARKSH